MEVREIAISPENHDKYECFVEAVKRGDHRDNIRFSYEDILNRGYTQCVKATIPTDSKDSSGVGVLTTFRVKEGSQGGEIALIDFTLDSIRKARDIIAKASKINLGGDNKLEDQLEVIQLA